MANIPLKSIKFPDLADTYTVPSNAGELPYNKSATYPADTVGKALQSVGDSVAPAIIETATGSIASFTDGANVPVKDLVAEIVPLQSGSGDPSPDNVRPITGWTEAEIHVADGESPHIVDNVTTISFASAGTVYGGSIDVTSGVLTVTDKYLSFDGTENWENVGGSYPQAFRLYTNVLDCLQTQPARAKSRCNLFKTNIPDVAQSGIRWASNVYPDGLLYVYDETHASDTQGFKAMLGNTNLQFVCPLITPQTYQLTPTEVKTLLKNNNIWADTGDVTVEYVADTKTFIENLVNA